MGKKFQHTDKNAGGQKDSKGGQKLKPGSPKRGAASSKKLAKKPS